LSLKCFFAESCFSAEEILDVAVESNCLLVKVC
jgi:hypothetical protein